MAALNGLKWAQSRRGLDGSNAATVQASDALTPGSLVQSLPGAPDLASVQLAYADMSNADPSAATTDDGSGVDIDQMLATMEQGRMNVGRSLKEPSLMEASCDY